LPGRDPVAELTVDFTPETTTNWYIKVTVQVGGKPVGKGEAEVSVYETTMWQPLKHNYGPVATDENGVAWIGPVAGAYYLFGVKVDNIYYDVVATLKVEKPPVPAGAQAKKGIVIEDGNWRFPYRFSVKSVAVNIVPEVFRCTVCGTLIRPTGNIATCPTCGAVYKRGRV
jgi:hypothetical protein